MSSPYLQQKTLRITVSSKSIRTMMESTLLVCLVILGIVASTPAQRRSAPATGSTVRNQAFVSFQNERGEITCRDATAEERRKSAVRSGGGPTGVIYSGAPRRQGEHRVCAEKKSD